jgi:pyrroloquinoline-quinone synthase
MNSTSVQQSFQQIVDQFHLLKHPFYQAWMQGALTAEDLQDYAQQYYSHVQAFPRYVSAAHSLCEDPVKRRELFENLADEEGDGAEKPSHPELWARFAEGVGVSRDSLSKTSSRPAIQNVVGTFFRLTRSSYHEALGALYAYESQVPEIATSKIEGLKSNYSVQDARSLEFFQVHETADVYHRETVRKQLEALPETEKMEALQATQEAASVLWNFLSDVQARRVDAECTSH